MRLPIPTSATRFRMPPAEQMAGTAPYRRRHRWAISATWPAVGLELVLPTGGNRRGSVCRNRRPELAGRLEAFTRRP